MHVLLTRKRFKAIEETAMQEKLNEGRIAHFVAAL
jgi:hypothetical protein